MEAGPAILLGIVQGLTEFLPVSSTGHLILAREVFGISDTYGLAVDAMLHLATALAVAIYFRKDLLRIVYAFLYKVTGRPVTKEDWNMVVVLAIATVPAVIAGLLLEEYMETVFRSAVLVAWMLIIGSIIFIAAEWAGKRYLEQETVPSKWRALGIGLFQCLALIPGMSRSGMTISGGLFLGLDRASAARFGFLLSFPIILGSGGKKFLELLGTGALSDVGMSIVFGAIAAFLSGLFAIWFLMGFVKKHSLATFAVYRVLLAVGVLWFIGG